MSLKFLKLILGMLYLIFSVVATSQLYAQHSPSHHSDAVTTATPKLEPGQVVITGKVICLGCHLKKEKSAKAQCSIYGHTNALVVEKAIDAQGKKILEAKDKIYQFLHNAQSDKLVKDHTYAGKTVIITGKIYPEANIIEVNFFKEKKVKGGKVK
ncbi:MAG: hypothetical protein Q8O13_02410 [Candidatus Omnitrophota bacterium]|nr:hypothetical protein [Candidatus Omnitrophota bacterium]